MFRHQGKTRTANHNLQLASILSLVAGLVNVAGFLSIQILTTNVTGHFAFFVDAVFQNQLYYSAIYFLFVLFFFTGAFVSSFLLELGYKFNHKEIFLIPLIIEILLLLIVAIFDFFFINDQPNMCACILLFSMGLQNALVTKISNAVVRTTHLTGLFTDVGIDISQLFFYKTTDLKKKLYASIRLRLTIILFFFIGGIIGGFLYAVLGLKVLFIAALVLILGLINNYRYYFNIRSYIKEYL